MTQQIARIHNGVVVERTTLPDDVKLEEAFHSSLKFVPCTAIVEVGHTFDGANFAPPGPVELTPAQKQTAARGTYAAAMRAGCSVSIGKNTIVVPLDDVSLRALHSMAIRAALENDPSASFTIGGVLLGAGDFRAVILAVDDYVQATTKTLNEALA